MSGTDDLVTYEMRGDVALLGLNRPEKRNAISDRFVEAIHDAVTRASSEAKAGVIHGHGTHFCAGLDLTSMAEEDPDMILVRLNKEEEGVGISAGAHFAGRKSVMMMQNHGFLTSINGIVSLSQLYKIPLLMMISYRGEMGERDPWQTQGGTSTEPVLQALGIPYNKLSNPDTVLKELAAAQTLAESSQKPVALLLTRDLMWEE